MSTVITFSGIFFALSMWRDRSDWTIIRILRCFTNRLLTWSRCCQTAVSRRRSVLRSAPPGPPVCESHTYMLVPGSEWGWGQAGQTPHRSHWRSHPVSDKNINLYTCMFNQWEKYACFFKHQRYDQYNPSVLHIPFAMFELKRNFCQYVPFKGFIDTCFLI